MKNTSYSKFIIILFIGFINTHLLAQFNLVQPTSITGTASLFTGSSIPTDIIVDPIVIPTTDPTTTTVSSYSDGSGFNNVYIWLFTSNTITMDFGAPTDITGVAIWNAFASGAYLDPGFLEPDHSVNLANFEFFSSGSSLGSENINVLFPDDAFGELYPLSTTYVGVDQVVMTVISNHGGNETAMQEIAFNTSTCTDLVTVISATEICLGEEITLDASSTTGGTITWDGGVINAVPHIPAAAGVITYTASSTSLSDCPFTVDITILDLPVITANVDDSDICIGESVIFTGGGADTYVWDLGVDDGVLFEPLGVGTVTYTVTGTDLGTTCENTATVDVNVNALPIITANVDAIEICLGESVIFTGGGADTYVWDLGVIDGTSFTPATIGTTTHEVIGTDLVTTCENTASIDVNVIAPPSVVASVDEIEICLGESVIFTGGGADTYVWDMGVLDGVSFTPAGLGTVTYSVTGTDLATTCENTASIDVSVTDLIAVTANVDALEICLGESVTFTGSGADTYVWNLGVMDGISFTPASEGTVIYTLTGTDGGCTGTDDIAVTVFPLPNVLFAADQTQACSPFNIGFSSGTPGDEFYWEFGDGSTGAGSPISHTYTNDGLFDVTLTVTSADGCTNSNSYTDYIEIFKMPIASFYYSPTEIDITDTRVFFNNTSLYANSYEWNFGDGTSVSSEFEPVHDFPLTGNQNYTVELIAKNDFGCEDRIEQIITVKDALFFYVPNSFTPDGDSFNESFKPIFDAGLDVYDYHLSIYNRWGEIVFESHNVAYGWNGSYGTENIVQDGIYVWKIEFGETMSDKVHKIEGTVLLLK